MSRRTAALAILVTTLSLSGPAASRAAQTHTFTAGAELLQQNAFGQWNLNLFVGATFGTDDGSPVSPVRTMRMSFPGGARFNGDAFKVCTKAQVGDAACPKGSKIGTGTALTKLGKSTVDAKITVFNGPGNANKRQMFFYSRALTTVEFVLDGTMRKTRGAYGYVMDVNVPPIIDELVPGGVPITDFQTTIGGVGRRNGKPVPLVSSPTACRAGGWKYAATFTRADGSSATSNLAISCRLTATPTS